MILDNPFNPSHRNSFYINIWILPKDNIDIRCEIVVITQIKAVLTNLMYSLGAAFTGGGLLQLDFTF